MEENFFAFTGDSPTEYAFLCWCLNWYNDKSEPRKPLFYMARDILALMGEEELPDDQKIDVCQWEEAMDILVNLRGRNRVVVIDHMIGSMQYETELSEYRRRLLLSKNVLGIDESAAIRTVLFHTCYCTDFYHAVMADCKINKESFLAVLGKYENINGNLDVYIDSLRQRISLDEKCGQYKTAIPYENRMDWNISHSRIAQYNFMRDIFRTHYPSSMWQQRSDVYKIQQGDDSGGKYPWTEFPFFERMDLDGEKDCYLCWRLETYENAPCLSLRYWELSKQNYKAHASTLLSVSLSDALADWENEAEKLKCRILLVTDYILQAASSS